MAELNLTRIPLNGCGFNLTRVFQSNFKALVASIRIIIVNGPDPNTNQQLASLQRMDSL